MAHCGRWPEYQTTRNSDCFRERILKERAHSRPERPLTVPVSVPRPYRVPNETYTWKPLTAAQLSISPRGAHARGFGHPQSTSTSHGLPRSSTPYSILQPQPPMMPLAMEHMKLPPRTPQHVHACHEMTQMTWFEPPLVMSRNYSEPRGFFNSCLERSTASVANPAAPLVPWKVKFT